MKKKKIFILLIISFLLMTLFSSHLFIVAEANHECVGEHCHICQTIEAIENNLKNFICETSKLTFIIALLFLTIFSIGNEFECLNKTTLITLKVKFTN